jgi:hypothetical protein
MPSARRPERPVRPKSLLPTIGVRQDLTDAARHRRSPAARFGGARHGTGGVAARGLASDFHLVPCCAVHGKGRDYSDEIYTADLKLKGVGRRLGIGIGPLRYLMVSLTYGTKGYLSGVLELRERQAGIEIRPDLRADPQRSSRDPLDEVGLRTSSGVRQHTVPVHECRRPLRSEPRPVARPQQRQYISVSVG